MMTGRATAAGTCRYAARAGAGSAPGHFRALGPDLQLSSLGIGTYLGRDDEDTDTAYHEAIVCALQRGVNVVDSAINYRHQRSERVVGRALADLVQRGEVGRDEVLVATKGGYVPFDGAVPRDPAVYFRETYVRSGIVKPEELVGGVHCMTPRYLADQIERSRQNLGLETIDIYYIHNPESQLAEVGEAEFLRRIRAAFAALEASVAAGRIGCYGTATWNGYRQRPGTPGALSLEALVTAAREVGGPDHHFRVIQLPYNLAMTEAYVLANQRVGDESVPVLEAARRLGVYVVTSASVYQGQLARNLPPVVSEFVPGLATDAQRALQFVRSTPGVGTALVGMQSVAHVKENTGVAALSPLTPPEFARLFHHG